MKYNVIKPFKNIDGKFLRVNDCFECNKFQAIPLLRNRMIGNYSEKAINNYQVPEVVIAETTEEIKPKRKYRKRKEQ